MSGIEEKLIDYIFHTRYENLPAEVVNTAKNITLTNIGTSIAGAMLEGCPLLVNQIKGWGGKEEATILLHGGKVPAHNAVLINSYMARALDFDDGIRPGMHVGASAVPAALASAELAGGCSGEEFLTALAMGAELADRINLVSDYDGFDPTGICSIFAATAACSRVLRLDRDQTWNALAIAFNKSGGSFQSNIEGTLSVRLIQGFVSQGAILSVQLAKNGFTGPKSFLEGVYGYFHLYAKDKYDPQAVVGELGKRFEINKTLFKKYPSCGDTLGSTDAILHLVKEKNIPPDDIIQVDIKVTPYVYKLVGNPFQIRDNPRVDAQFNIRYCVANALLRKSSKLEHFEASSVRDPKIAEIVKKVNVTPDPGLDKRGETALEMKVLCRDGTIYNKSLDFPPGFPENPLSREENMERFRSCIQFSGEILTKEKVEKLVSLVSDLERLKDVRILIPFLLIKDSEYSIKKEANKNEYV
jgi:2-methylcitrate dehydratase PrpD